MNEYDIIRHPKVSVKYATAGKSIKTIKHANVDNKESNVDLKLASK
ncbi:hypothetical protein QPK13_18090 [Photorhabdus tasmaniensis]